MFRRRLALLLLTTTSFAAPAFAQQFTNPDGSGVRLYGQLNPAYLSYDDGMASNSALVDNSNSNSRAGIFVYWPLPDDQKLTFNFEASLGFFQSSSLNITSFEDQQWYSWNETNIRRLELLYEGAFGRVAAGQGSMATDGTAKVDYSGTTVIGTSSYSDTAGGFAFRHSDGTLSDITISDVFVNLEGTRRMRLRYDTPDLNGLHVAVAAGENTLTGNDTYYADAAMRFERVLGPVEVGAGLGYNFQEAKSDSSDATEAVIGSVAVVHTQSGLNAQIAAGEYMGDPGRYLYVKLGWTGGIWDVGRTALAGEFYSSSDIGLDGSGESWGLQAVQYFDDLSTEVYLGYRVYSLVSDTASYDDSSSLMVGARWRF